MSLPRRQGGDSQKILDLLIAIEGIHAMDGSQCQGLPPNIILPLKYGRGSDCVIMLFLNSEGYDKFDILRRADTLKEAMLLPDSVRRCNGMNVPDL